MLRARGTKGGAFHSFQKNCRVFTSEVVASNDAAARRDFRFPPKHCRQEKNAAQPRATQSPLTGPPSFLQKNNQHHRFALDLLHHTMDRRTYESPMDWEYHSQPPMDQSSPFAKLSQKQPTCKPFARARSASRGVPSANPLPSLPLLLPCELRAVEDADRAPLSTATFASSPTKLQSPNPNPFAFGATAKASPLKPQDQPRPPHATLFNPQLQHKPSAPAFRNPAFTTPQRRMDELVFSEYSGAESSPALTDTSEMPADTPEFDREDEALGKLTLTPAAGRTLFSKTLLRNHVSGRGEIARGNRDKVRKRKRLQGDRDVGSVRPRLPHDSDDSDSDWEQGSGTGNKAKKAGKAAKRGWFSNFLSAISDHPSAPAILSKWLQLGVNVILLGTVLFGIFAMLSQVRSDLAHATEKARTALINEASLCADNFQKNACSPRASRPPALDGPCNEWEACMNQDSSAVLVTHVTMQNVAEILNEFFGALTFKTWVSLQTVHPLLRFANAC